MRNTRWLTAALLALGLTAAACGGGDTTGTTDPADAEVSPADAGGDAAGDELKVAFVYVGPIGDAGWTWAHDEGRKHLEEEMPNVTTTYIESVPEGAESQRVFEDLAEDGNDLIFGTSFGYMDAMLAAAENYPDTVFMHATGYKTAENMGTYFGAAEEARYLSGLAAGAETETDLIGYVAAFPIPEVLRGINAFTLGVRETNPDAEVQVVWSSTWFGPDIERQAAESLLDAGADVIAMHQDSPAPGQAADERGAAWVGYNSDMQRFAEDAWLTAPVWDWGPYYVTTATQVLEGTWTSEQYYGDMAGGMVDLAPFGDRVSEETRQLIETRKQEIIDGSFEIFEGPLVARDGTGILAEGEVATLEELLATDYLVEGVLGEIPAAG